MEKELEVKVLNIDLDELEDKIINLGGKLIGDERQENILIDSSKKPIKENIDGYLRIRVTEDRIKKQRRKTLTFKENIKNEKIRKNIEYNISIDDEDSMLSLLEKLGYNKIQKGYKDRRSYELLNGKVDLDIWDKNTYPHPYAEIEVKHSSDLDEIIMKLDISRDNISLKSIKELQNDLKVEGYKC